MDRCQISTRATQSVALYARQMQFTWDHIHYLQVRAYQNVKSIRQAVFKLPHSQEISCIGYNVNLQTAVAAILVFVECVRGLSGTKAISKCQVNPTSSFQTIAFTSNILHRVPC